jgi:hypothetical protein
MADVQVPRMFVNVFKGFMVKRQAHEHNDSVSLYIFMLRMIMLNEHVCCLHHRVIYLEKGS